MRLTVLRFTAFTFPLLFLLALTISPPAASLAQSSSKNSPTNNSETGTLTVDVGPNFVAPTSNFLQMGVQYTNEVEPNGSIATANVLVGRSADIHGNLYPAADEDFFAFTAEAGDRVYVATMTALGANYQDSLIEIQDSAGSVLELDDNDGVFGTSASSIAGTTIPTAGTYYIRMRGIPSAATLHPYNLYLHLQNGSPMVETETNGTPAQANPLPTNGWVSGTIDPAADNDFFSLNLNAGDTVYLSLDLDPERDNVTWDGRVGFGLFGTNVDQLLTANDESVISPNSEALFMTVKNPGVYYAFVDHPTDGEGSPFTYNLSVAVFPAAPQASVCNTYHSADTPLAIPDSPGSVSSTIVVPGHPIIADLNVQLDISHTFMSDLDATLISPANNINSIFVDIGNVTPTGPQTTMDLILDDEAALPPVFPFTAPLAYKPGRTDRLSWFDGSDGGGNWTLTLYDDTTGDSGVLHNWSITLCELEITPPVCPINTTPVTVYNTDFEAGADGFTHSGTVDEWELGLPTLAANNDIPPLASFQTCHSGTSCWKTDLDGSYEVDSTQNLLSPHIDLTGLVGPVVVSWYQRYQIESATFDHASVTAQQVGGGDSVRLWEWYDATMTSKLGENLLEIGDSSGWSIHTARIDELAGLNTELLFHLDSDTSISLGGLAIDDVSVTACMPLPTIELTKTVGMDSGICATSDTLNLTEADDVFYCYTIKNTSPVTLTTHTLVDDQLGLLLDNYPYTVSPGAMAFLTATTFITESVINVAEWTVSNGVVTATATATATVNLGVSAYEVDLSTDMALTGAAGSMVTYTISITNNGNVQDTFNLEATAVWTTTLSTSSVVLNAGETDEITVVVYIPANSANLDDDMAMITATSQGDSNESDMTHLTTTAIVETPAGYTLYLPIIDRN